MTYANPKLYRYYSPPEVPDQENVEPNEASASKNISSHKEDLEKA